MNGSDLIAGRTLRFVPSAVGAALFPGSSCDAFTAEL